MSARAARRRKAFTHPYRLVRTTPQSPRWKGGGGFESEHDREASAADSESVSGTRGSESEDTASEIETPEDEADAPITSGKVTVLPQAPVTANAEFSLIRKA